MIGGTEYLSKIIIKIENEIKKRNIKPTKVLPLWDLLGVGLGFGSTILVKKAAMLCTASVEEVIDEHYLNQINALTSLIYNVRTTKFKKSKAYASLLAGDTQKFLDEAFSSTKGFVKAGGKVLDGLVKRRQEEKALFETRKVSREDTKLFSDKVAQAGE